MKTWSLLALALALGLVVGPASSPADAAVSHPCIRAGELRFKAADGTRLAAHRFGRGSTAVVLAHERNQDLCQWLPYARRLAGLGYLVIAVDSRNNGQSQRRSYPASQRLGADVATAAGTARRLGAKKVFLVGASIGGSAVLVAGANVRPPVDGVVSLSGAADLVGAAASVKNLRVPVLYLAAKDDTRSIDFGADAQRLYNATPSADKAITIVPGSDHGVQLMARDPEARNLVESFISSH